MAAGPPVSTMQSIEVLGREHHWIRHMLDCLDKLVERCEMTGRLDANTAPELLALFDYFADGMHQMKEERFLITRLLHRADVSQKGYIGTLLGDHERERRRMQSMRSNLLGAVYGEPLCVREFVGQARTYSELHRKHMAHENVVLLPMATKLLDEEDDRMILEGFRRLEESSPRTTKEVFGYVEGVCKRLGVPVEGRFVPPELHPPF